ncbi:MAG: tyrosine-type recombinase/integrase [Alloprevotella sp.]
MQYIEDFLLYLCAERGYSQRTADTYGASLRDFRRFCMSLEGQPDWKQVDADVVRQWMAAEMQRGCTGRYVAKQLSALRSFYRYLLRMQRVQHDPVRLVKNPKVHLPLPTFLKDSEIDRLFDDVAYPEGFEGQRDRLVLLTFYHTGIRLSELRGLDVTDVDLVRCELKVTGKRNKQRIVPFGEELCSGLKAYVELRDQLACADGALFVTLKGKRMTKVQVYGLVRHYLSLVTTQKKKSPHVLRHTFATAMLNHGADLEAIRDLLGHESIRTTEVYTHTTFADLKKEYERAHPRA